MLCLVDELFLIIPLYREYLVVWEKRVSINFNQRFARERMSLGSQDHATSV